MRNVEVQALQTRQLMPRGNNAKTNDRGEFRLFWLEPGMYYVMINPNPLPDVTQPPYSRPSVGYIPSDPDATFVTTYFPGSADVSKAQPIQIGSEEVDLRAIQVAALPTRKLRIHISSTGGDYFRPIIAVRSLTDLSSPFVSFTRPTQLAPDQFELRTGLMPGEYRVLVQEISRNRPFIGGKTVRIDRADPDVIDIRLFPTISVQGLIKSDRTISSLTVTAIPETSLESAIPVFAEVRPNGKFVLEGVAPGTYTIQVDGLHPGESFQPDSVKFTEGVESANLILTIKQ